MKETEILVVLLLLTMVLLIWADRNRPIRIIVLFSEENAKKSTMPRVPETTGVPKHHGFCCP